MRLIGRIFLTASLAVGGWSVYKTVDYLHIATNVMVQATEAGR